MSFRTILASASITVVCLGFQSTLYAKDSVLLEAYIADGDIVLIGTDLCVDHPVLEFGTNDLIPQSSSCEQVDGDLEMLIVTTNNSELSAGSYSLFVREEAKKSKDKERTFFVTIGDIGAQGPVGEIGVEGEMGIQG